MYTLSRPRSFIAVALPLTLLILSPAYGQEQEAKPSLSAEIQAVLLRDGAEAATERFNALFPAQKDRYEVDQKGFAELAGQVMQGGDFAAGQAVMQMLSVILEDSMAEFEIPEMPAPPSAADKPAKKTAPDSQDGKISFGPARTDLARFTGMYGTPENVEKGRVLFVAESCDGHLVSGPMWADTQPWWMRSEADNVFDYSFQSVSVHMEFRVGADGKATAMIHNLDYVDSPLPRSGPLPEEWTDCVRPSWG